MSAPLRESWSGFKAEICNIMAAVKQGMLHASMRDAVTEIEAPKAQLQHEVAALPRPPPVIHPNSPISIGARWSSCTSA
jgi:hypothetical protein